MSCVIFVSDTNQSVEPKKIAGRLKILDLNKRIFFIKEVKNKGTD